MKYNLAWWLFWGSLGLILYTSIGFPLLIALHGLLRPRPVKSASHTPMVSMIIVAYNEAPVIAHKLDNTFTLDYPRDCLEVIIAAA
jgi:poly-beta-1,6-N-acetyl-D-glucosamine synthase